MDWKQIGQRDNMKARIVELEKEIAKKDKQYKWLKGHYDRRGEHMQAYKDAIKVLIPEGEHYKLCSDYFAKVLLKRFAKIGGLVELDRKRVHDRLEEKYNAASRNLELYADKCGGSENIKGYMIGILDGMALTAKSETVCMEAVGEQASKTK